MNGPPPAVPSLAQPARGNPYAWSGPDSYPAAGMRRGVQGRTVVRLAIGPDGRVTGCTILTSSGDADLDRATCAIPEVRGRLSPARAADGTAIAGSYILPVRWSLSDAGAPPPARAAPARHQPAPAARHDWLERLLAAHHIANLLAAAAAFATAGLRRRFLGIADGQGDPGRMGRRKRFGGGRLVRLAVWALPTLLVAGLLAWAGL